MNVAYSGSPGSADKVTSPIQRGPQIVEHKPDRTAESIRTRSFARTGASDRYRRLAAGSAISVVRPELPLKSHSWPRPRMIGSNRGADIRTRPAKVLLSGSRQPVEERLCLSKIGGSAAFGKPAINRCEKVAGFGAAALVVAEPG